MKIKQIYTGIYYLILFDSLKKKIYDTFIF